MQTLSDRQLREITRLIEDYHTAFAVNVLGLGDVIDPGEVDRLKRLGLVSSTAKSLPEDAFLFGLLSKELGDAKSKGMSYSEFKKHLKTNPWPLSQEERFAVKHLKRSLFTHVKGLGNTVDKRTQQVLVDADQALRRRLASTIQHTIITGLERRKTVSEIAGELRRSTKDYARDWLRIVSTEVNNAFQEGKLQKIMKANVGRDPLVFKRPRPDCCEECAEAYTLDGSVPRTFHMSELVNNGSNVGRAKAVRKAVVGSHHPWCQCELLELPVGFEFDRKGRMVYVGFGD